MTRIRAFGFGPLLLAACLVGTPPLLAQAGGKSSPATLEMADSVSDQGMAAFEAERFEEAADLYIQSANLYQSLEGELSQSRMMMLNNAAISLERQERYDNAARLFGGVAQLLIDNNSAHPDELRVAMRGWSRTLSAQGRMQDALRVSDALLDWLERGFDPHSDTVINAMMERMMILYGSRRFEEATQFSRELLSRVQSASTPDPARIIWVMNYVTDAELQAGNFSNTEAFALESIALTEAHYGAESEQLAYPLLNLASAILRRGECERTLQLVDRTRALLDQSAEDFRRRLVNQMLDLEAECQLEIGRPDLAEAASRAGLTHAVTEFGETSQVTVVARNNLAAILFRMGRHADSLALHQENLQAGLRTLDSTHPDVGLAHENVGEAALVLGDYTTSIPNYRQALAIYHSEYGEDYAETARATGGLARALLETGELTEALELIRFASASVARRITEGRNDLDSEHRRAILETHIETAFALSIGDAP